MIKKTMSKDELIILLAQYRVEFTRELDRRSPKVIHLGKGHDGHYNFFTKTYFYLIKKPMIKITYLERYSKTPRTFVLTVHYVETNRGGNQSFYGYSTEYGHNVYITADESFLNSIQTIEHR